MVTIRVSQIHRMPHKPQVIFEKVTDDVLAQYKENAKEIKPLASFFGKGETDVAQENF